MMFKDYFSSLSSDEKSSLASAMGTSVAYLSQIAHGHRKAGANLLLKIESATSGKVTPYDLRPDLQPPNGKAV